MLAEGKDGGALRKFVFGLRLALGGITADNGDVRYRDHVGIMLRNKSTEDCNLRFSACILARKRTAAATAGGGGGGNRPPSDGRAATRSSSSKMLEAAAGLSRPPLVVLRPHLQPGQ